MPINLKETVYEYYYNSVNGRFNVRAVYDSEWNTWEAGVSFSFSDGRTPAEAVRQLGKIAEEFVKSLAETVKLPGE